MSSPAGGNSPRGRSSDAAYEESAPTGKWGRKLLQGAANGRELVVQGDAEAVHHGNDGQRDTRGNQPVFDRRRTGFVQPELLNHAFQASPPFQFQAVLA